MDYSSLYTTIQDWAWDESVELSGNIPLVIQLAELRLRRELPPIAYDVVTSGTFSGVSGAQAVLSLPADRTADRYFTVTISGTPQPPLEHKTLTYLKEYWPVISTTGTPRYYAQQGPGSLRIAPTPSSGITYEWGYRAQLAPLSGTNTTNWLTSNAADALLQACLVEAARYKADDAMVTRFDTAYQNSKAGVIAEHFTSLSDDYGGQATPRARE